MWISYETAFEEERARLTELAQSQARLIEAVARFDAVYSKEYPKGEIAATLSQIIDAHKHYKGFGMTGEFTLACREGENIVFLLSHRHYDLENPKPVPIDSDLAEPMRLALSGESGTVVSLDYRGMKVLAAHEPVKELGLGIVAKIDLAEIRAPFVKAILISTAIMIALVAIGTALFFRVSNPIIRRLKEQTNELQIKNQILTEEIEERHQVEKALRASERRLKESQKIARLGQWELDLSTNTLYWSEGTYDLFEIDPNKFEASYEAFLDAIHPDDREFVHNAYTESVKSKTSYDIIHRLLLRDGTVKYVNEICRTEYDKDGNPLRSLGTVQDITERKRAEEERERLFKELQNALDSVKTLKGMLPICASCKKIRDDKGYWNQIERYIATHSEAEFTHGICPECIDKLYGNKDWFKKR